MEFNIVCFSHKYLNRLLDAGDHYTDTDNKYFSDYPIHYYDVPKDANIQMNISLFPIEDMEKISTLHIIKSINPQILIVPSYCDIIISNHEYPITIIYERQDYADHTDYTDIGVMINGKQQELCSDSCWEDYEWQWNETNKLIKDHIKKYIRQKEIENNTPTLRGRIADIEDTLEMLTNS